jgi:hypothetical protein
MKKDMIGRSSIIKGAVSKPEARDTATPRVNNGKRGETIRLCDRCRAEIPPFHPVPVCHRCAQYDRDYATGANAAEYWDDIDQPY